MTCKPRDLSGYPDPDTCEECRRPGLPNVLHRVDPLILARDGRIEQRWLCQRCFEELLLKGTES